ncbi:hypothetical protein MTO96_003489 [Rhipicephalus appendiculatus]
MAVASPRTIFPITGWENDLKLIPPLSDEKVLKFYSTRSATDRCLDRSYNFHVESYVIPSSVRTNKCKQRKEWTAKGLQAIASSRDISHVPAVKYGIANEAVAAVRYEEVLKAMGHNVTVSTCGLLLNPAFPWLGASPDRIVYDPLELSYGVVEI